MADSRDAALSQLVPKQRVQATREKLKPTRRGRTAAYSFGRPPTKIGVGVSVLREHTLDFRRISGPRERKHQQHARLDRREILAGDAPADFVGRRPGVTSPAPAAARRNASGTRTRGRDDEYAFLRRVVDAVLLRAARGPGPGAGHDDPLGPRVSRGLDEIAVGALIHEQHVDARQLRYR